MGETTSARTQGEAAGAHARDRAATGTMPPLERECFFISPIGREGTPERQRSDIVLQEIVGRAAQQLGLEAVRGDRIAQPGEVTAQVVHHLAEARAAVADLTGRNPNVFYELAVRQSAGRPVVLIARAEEDLPFNIHTMRTIFYDETQPTSIETCARELAEQIANSYLGAHSDVAELVHQSYARRQLTPAGYEIGCRVGRRRIECGIVQVEVPTSGLPSAGEVHVAEEISPVVTAETEGRRLWRDDRDRFLDVLHGGVARLVEAAAEREVEILSIGVAVPGAVKIAEGRFSTPVEGAPFEAGQAIGHDLAEGVCQTVGLEAVDRVFGTPDRRSLEQRIHVDNDARSVARWLAAEHAGDPLWRDACCIFVGSGVGSGLVLDGQVYYGAHLRAGEVGHVTLQLEDRLSIGDVEIRRRLCSCGKRAFHFETLVGVGGLGQLASAVDEAKLTEIRRTLDPSWEPPSAPGPAWTIDAYDAAGFTILRAFADGLHFSDDFEPYLLRVADVYAKVFGMGIGALIDILDVSRVALCGPIPELFQHVGPLRDKLSTLPTEGLVEPAKIAFEWGDMSEWGWRGAALLSRDPGYLTRR